MTVFKVLVTHHDIPKIAYDHFKEAEGTVQLIVNQENPYPSYDEIKAKVAGVHAIFWVSKHKLDKTLIDAAGPQLKVVATMSAGVNNIDVQYLKSKNIKLANTPDVVSDATANMGIFLAQAAGRRALEGRREILNETWTFGPQWLLGYDLTNSKVGIVGLGGIGQTIAKRLKAFDVAQIFYTGHKEKPEGVKLGAKFVNLDTLLRESDFVFASCPLTDETRHMFNKEAFCKMKKTSVFVNISRGEVVKQEDLIEALKNDEIFAAGLDVMTPEPLPRDHELLTLPNCYLTPHIGTATFDARRKMADLTAQNLLRGLLDEEMLTPVF